MTSTRATPFTAALRRALLDEFHAVSARLDATPASVDPDAADLARHAVLRRSYREQLPVVPVSRCPFTQVVYEHSLDAFGIDGPWWDARSTNRPLELMIGTVLAFTGALTMATTIERAPFLVRPGPGAPFVVPRMLRRSGVRAVISSMAIGAHTGYVIVYFADPAPDDLEGFNDWGTDFYQFEYDTDRLGWHQGSETAADHDFDLEPYLTSGQLLWIAPGDETMTLRDGAAECPYVGTEGCRVPQLVQDGERWLDEFPLDEDTETELDVAPEPPVESAPVPPPAPKSVPSARACAACGGDLKATSKFCPSCGTPVVSAPMPVAPPAAAVAGVCAHCGQPRRPDAKFCRSCGKA